MISIVIPLHNEAELLATTVEGVLDAARTLGWEFELVLVENGSTDTTWELCEQHQAAHVEVRALREAVGDYGNAVRAGLRSCRGEWAVVFDCDLWDMEFATEALAALAKDESAGFVVASKTLQGSNDERSALRRAGTRVFSALVRRSCGLRVSDTHGMKVVALTRVRAELEACRLVGHVFDTELLLRCERSGFHGVEIPCTVQETRPARTGYLRRVPSALHGVWQLRRMLLAEQKQRRGR